MTVMTQKSKHNITVNEVVGDEDASTLQIDVWSIGSLRDNLLGHSCILKTKNSSSNTTDANETALINDKIDCIHDFESQYIAHIVALKCFDDESCNEEVFDGDLEKEIAYYESKVDDSDKRGREVTKCHPKEYCSDYRLSVERCNHSEVNYNNKDIKNITGKRFSCSDVKSKIAYYEAKMNDNDKVRLIDNIDDGERTKSHPIQDTISVEDKSTEEEKNIEIHAEHHDGGTSLSNPISNSDNHNDIINVTNNEYSARIQQQDCTYTSYSMYATESMSKQIKLSEDCNIIEGHGCSIEIVCDGDIANNDAYLNNIELILRSISDEIVGSNVNKSESYNNGEISCSDESLSRTTDAIITEDAIRKEDVQSLNKQYPMKRISNVSDRTHSSLNRPLSKRGYEDQMGRITKTVYGRYEFMINSCCCYNDIVLLLGLD